MRSEISYIKNNIHLIIPTVPFRIWKPIWRIYMKRKLIVFALILVFFAVLAGNARADLTGDITFADGKFNYAGQQCTKLNLVRYGSIFTMTDGEDVLEFKMITDKNLGKIYIYKTKKKYFEFSSKSIKCIIIEGKDIEVDLQ
jgi:hypothetical protein